MFPGGYPPPWLPMTFPISPTGTPVVLSQPISIDGIHKDRVAQVDGTSPKSGDSAVASPLSVQPPSGESTADVVVKMLPPLLPLVVNEPSASTASGACIQALLSF